MEEMSQKMNSAGAESEKLQSAQREIQFLNTQIGEIKMKNDAELRKVTENAAENAPENDELKYEV